MSNNAENPSQPDPQWLRWARELHSISQNGLTYAENEYDRERYNRLQQIAAEMMARQADHDYRKILDLFATDTGYLTPKVDVRAFVLHENRVLLVRERADNDRWTLPGGWADPNDTPAQAAERETLEETGYQVRATRILAVYDRSHPRHGHYPPTPQYCYKLFLLCTLQGGQPVSSHETGESRFFARHQLPQDISIARVTPSQIHHFFHMMETGATQTDFD